ncbi:MAG TPA: transposase, partial [Ktedonobacteraceae bacterium]|nr:transposase [Ktedonobacteraceae bacterium]
MSRKPHNASEEEKKKRKLKKKSKQTITRAVTHIRLLEANAGKLSTLDALMSVYLELCQQYTTLFCQAESKPDKWSEPVLETQLSERLHRVALQQAAGIAQSFRTNRTSAYQTYRQDVAAYEAAKAQAEAEGRMATFKRREPSWTEWKLPVLRVPVMQANANVVVVEPSTDSTFDYWLRISTLDKGHPLRVPVKLAAYHKKALAGKTLNTSTTLSRRKGAWWLTLSFDEELPLRTEAAAPVVGVDVGIANFVTTSTGQSYGTFHGALAR